jgi:hypothetical protein
MMTPEPRSTIPGNNPRSRRTAQSKLVLRASCQSLSVSATKPPPGELEPTDVIDEDVHAPESLEDFADDFLRPFGGAEIGLDEEVRGWRIRGSSSRHDDHGGAAPGKTFSDGFAHAFGPAGDQGAFADKLIGIGGRIHIGVHKLFGNTRGRGAGETY